MKEEFEPDDPEVLMAAFKVLDEEGTGVIELDLMETYITEMGIPFLAHESKEFKSFICGSEKEKTKFYYEDYVQDWKAQIDKHKYNFLEKDYEAFDAEKSKKKKQQRKAKKQ